MKIKLDSNTLQYMNMFTGVTGARLKDCFFDKQGTLVFVVEENELGRAIGKKGFKVKQLEKKMNRKIKIVEFNPDLVSFVRNVVYPLGTKEIKEEEGTVYIEPADLKTRGMLIGRSAQNLQNYAFIVKRYFNIKELRA